MTPRTAAPALGTAAVLVGLTFLTGCTFSDDPEPPPGAGEFRLVSYDSCEQAAEQLRAAAREHVTAWGFGGAGVPGVAPGLADGDDGAGEQEAIAADQARAAQPNAPAEEPPAHSGTNVQESGVDEPDLVKTDGSRIVTVSHGVLRVVDAGTREQTGSLDLLPAVPDGEVYWVAADLFLHGDRALVLLNESYAWLEPSRLGSGPAADLPARPAPEQPLQVEPADPTEPVEPPEAPVVGPRLLLVDLAGPPRLLAEYTVDGGLVDARAVGGIARVVVRSAPRLELPALDSGVDEAERLAWNQAAIDATELSDWLPRYEQTVGGEVTTGLVDCTAVSHPESYTGTSMLTVLTFDLAFPTLGDGAPVTVVADGDTVYGSGPSLYIASDLRWRVVPGDGAEDDVARPAPEVDDRTEIHKFDASEPGPARYVGSGTVDGWLINQYAMSEWEGHLRVATTSGETWTDPEQSESAVHVLAERDGDLVEVGSVGGLGAGERIYAVRFAGPVGYVVTFRQIDPLYTVDLSDPAAPVVRGELKVEGYSSYLHPVGDGRLIGVGQEGDEEGRILGTQVSLYDVSDLSDPQRLATHHVAQGFSEAEVDPHAFLWWPADRLLVVPLAEQQGSFGALLLRLEGDELTELDLISHPASGEWDAASQIRRSLVIEDILWTVSDNGLAAHDLSTRERLAWLPFDR